MSNENRNGRPYKDQSPFTNIFRSLIKGATQQEVANLVGVSRQNVGKWISGETTPDINTLVKIADAYGVSTDYLLGRKEVKSMNTQLKAVCEFTGLSENVILNVIGSKTGMITDKEQCTIPLPFSYCTEIRLKDVLSVGGLINWFFGNDTNDNERNEWIDLFRLIIYYCYQAEQNEIITLKHIISDFFNEIFPSYRHIEKPRIIDLTDDYPF